MHDGHDGHSHGHSDAQDRTHLVLAFTLEHNKEHAKEMRALAEKLRGEGKADAAGLIEDAIKDYEAGNAKFEHAIQHL
ncbi:MAG: hypothetical protein LBR44_02470 [Clostridiales Family XIII bacterium]|jgi:hypothetical protein|nr:hypothetical protein [Clostridiales Family XIII bacterium]